MSDEIVLHVCHYKDGGLPFHPCRRAAGALDDAGVEYRLNVFDRNKPGGLMTKGKRPELKRLSGQEKLPVLELADGSTVNGSGAIVDWARARSAGG